MRGPFVDPLAIAMARKLGGGGGGVKPSGEIAIDKNGTYDVTQYASANVNVSGGGGGGDSSKPVRFLDYDGTVVQSYTATEFAALEAMPENPDHSGDEIPLTAQGWNWSLADAKTYVAKYGALEVGQMYITTDGKTHIKIYIDPDTPANRRVMTLRWQQSVANGVTVDWGDGTEPESFSGTSAANHDHTYATTGWYDITLAVTDGTMSFSGDSSTSIIGPNKGVDAYKCALIRAVFYGSKMDTNAIGNYAFYNCYSLTILTIPNGITSFGANAFNSCYTLTSITIPGSVTSIGNSTFANCYSLTSILIPDGVTSLGSSVFNYCYKLARIAIPSGLTRIGSGVFSSCFGLTSVTIPNEVISIGGNAFSSCYILTSVTIPEVTYIDDGAFNGCRALTRIALSDRVTHIGASAFASCYSLTNVMIPDGITSISQYMLSGCSSLTSITIPAEVASIGSSAFNNCSSVSEYHFLPTTPPTIQSSTFNGIPSDCIIYVPAASVEDYKAAANWSELASKIQAEPA